MWRTLSFLCVHDTYCFLHRRKLQFIYRCLVLSYSLCAFQFAGFLFWILQIQPWSVSIQIILGSNFSSRFYSCFDDFCLEFSTHLNCGFIHSVHLLSKNSMCFSSFICRPELLSYFLDIISDGSYIFISKRYCSFAIKDESWFMYLKNWFFK